MINSGKAIYINPPTTIPINITGKKITVQSNFRIPQDALSPNIKNFPTHYKQYGNTEALYDNYMSSPTTAIDGTYLSGLARRREAEWKLFNKGIYTYN